MTALSFPVFPYKKDPHGISYPVIPVALIIGKVKKDYYALIDSGATISVFRSEVAESLGITLEKGKLKYLSGVGGHIKAYIHQIEMEVVGKRFKTPVVFSREYFVSFNLLGRDSFFRHFKITFDEAHRKVSLT